MSVYRLTNAQWEYIRLLLLVRPRLRGCLPADNRQTLEAILHVLTTGCPWSELPRSLGNYVTAWRRFRKWGADGTFARIWPYLRAAFEHAEKIDFSRHKLECLQLPTDTAAPDQTKRRARGANEPARPAAAGRILSSGKAHGQFFGEDCLIASPGAQDMNLMPTWGHPADVPLTVVNFTLQTAFVT